MGGNVRVGLEDSLWLGRGRCGINAEQVAKARGFSRAGLAIASPNEAREMLKLKEEGISGSRLRFSRIFFWRRIRGLAGKP
jgi:hypothetical protein